jgi:beta-lactamase class A
VSELSWLEVLEHRLRHLADSVRAEWGIFVHFVNGGAEIAIDADRTQDTMSLIKVPILVTLMRKVDAGEINLSTRITLADDDRRLGTGVLFLFDAGATLTLKDAAWLMVVVSDNTATDLVLDAVGGPAAVNATMAALGLDAIRMTGDALAWFRALGGSMDPELATVAPGEFARRGYPDKAPAAFAAARERYHFGPADRPFGLATARSLGLLLLQILEGRCASPESCALIRTMLRGQQLQTMLPKYLWGVVAEHKTGNFQPFISSDIGIFTPSAGSPVIISVMTQKHRGQRALVEDTVARMGELVVHAAEGLPG